jgi:hypothetical protein
LNDHQAFAARRQERKPDGKIAERSDGELWRDDDIRAARRTKETLT